MKIKKGILLATLVASTLLLGACSPKVKSESQIKSDLVGQAMNLNGGIEAAMLGSKSIPITEVKDLEIIKRQSNKENKTDFVHVKTTLVSDSATIQSELELNYGLYDDKGWVIDNVRSVTDPIITPNKEIALEDITPFYRELFKEGEGKIINTSATEKGTSVDFEITIKKDGYTAIYNGTILAEFGFSSDSEKPLRWKALNKKLNDPKVIFDKEFIVTPETLKTEVITSEYGLHPTQYYKLEEKDIKSMSFNKEDVNATISTYGSVEVRITNIKLELNDGTTSIMKAQYTYDSGNFVFNHFMIDITKQ